MPSISQQLSKELNAQVSQIDSAVKLLDDGSTVPFIARYRKEATGGLDDTQLRTLEQRLSYLRDMEDRRRVILKSIEDQGKLTAELQKDILDADNKTLLEDLYLPYRPKRRTKGQIAIEAGIEPLADLLFSQPNTDPEVAAQDFLNPEKNFSDTKAVLEGAKYILMERFAEDAKLLEKVRKHLKREAHLTSTLVKGEAESGAKYRDYFEHSEPVRSIPSHRALAMFRGRNEGVLQLNIDPAPEQEETSKSSVCEKMIADHVGLSFDGAKADTWLKSVVQWTWKVKVALHLETEILGEMKEKSELEAINVFSKNLKDLLMSAPAGARPTLGLDPGLRTGVKVAVVDDTGKLQATSTIFPHAPQNHWDKSIRVLANLCKQYKIELVAIGNGTASRETDKLVGELMKDNPDLQLTKVMVSEAGASVYSASEFAANEFPDLDVSLRGAVSIARRLQDPLAELVKIEPKSIGVGQYQHDVNQSDLAKSLDAIVEDCVNAVGVDVNMASAPLLARVSGLNKTLANNIVAYRDEHGRFQNRQLFKKVTRLGPKAFEQAAGFLKISNGDNPLDASAVHPESYNVVKQIVGDHDIQVDQVIGNSEFLRKLDPKSYVTNDVGLPTVTDIISELDKPGRDPRPEFKTARFDEAVSTIQDLKPGLILEGVVSNVTNFGAFVDVGVHQDGLVHISSLTDKFVSDPHEVVKAGDIVKVKVLDVDLGRKRISFTMRMDEASQQSSPKEGRSSQPKQKQRSSQQKSRKDNAMNSAMSSAFAEAFAKAKK
ncbi:Tex family protein [Algicola sagamiensis]|uniref:Tex family protein n=1 Tax=Algicola sagamiensis TaxID=163869 RepID=UPI00036858FD|nr:Tex family protein [Algicola sagamiensis]